MADADSTGCFILEALKNQEASMNNPKEKTAENLNNELMAIDATQLRAFLYPGILALLMGTLLNAGDHYLFGIPLDIGGILLIIMGASLSSQKRSAIYDRYGLKCLNCKKAPGTTYAGLQAFKSGFCPHCQLKYDSLMKAV
jgi:hypothetical protein